MGAGRTTGCTHFGNLLPPFDNVSLLHMHLGCMGVSGDQIVAVIDFDHVAVGWVKLLHHHDAAGRGQDRRSGVGRKVQSGVQGRAPVDGIDAKTKR
ncbi:hypothetical protein D3C87_1830360 [compost metagenome]